MEKKLFAIECENVVLVVRPNGDTVIVTEATELVLGNAVMEQLVRNSAAYKSFFATKDEIVANLERDNVKLQNEIVGLKEELEHTKADKDKLQKELDDIADSAIQPIAKGYAVNIGNLSQGNLGYIFDIDGNFIADYGTDKRAKRVQYLLQEGKISQDVVMEIFGNAVLSANKAGLDDFNWDDVPVDGGEMDEDADGPANYYKNFRPKKPPFHPPHLHPFPPYYLILTGHNLHNTQSYPDLYHYDNAHVLHYNNIHILHYDDNYAYHSPNAQPHHVHNAFYNAHDNHLGDNAHNDADKHGLHHAQAATALSPL